MTEYERYLMTEWEMYQAEPKRFQATLAAVAGRRIDRALDVGCGAGQELLPFVQALAARGVGVDISPIAPETARRCFAGLECADRAEFHCCPAEDLPFPSGSFDVVTCRLALPFTRTRRRCWNGTRTSARRTLDFENPTSPLLFQDNLAASEASPLSGGRCNGNDFFNTAVQRTDFKIYLDRF